MNGSGSKEIADGQRKKTMMRSLLGSQLDLLSLNDIADGAGSSRQGPRLLGPKVNDRRVNRRRPWRRCAWVDAGEKKSGAGKEGMALGFYPGDQVIWVLL